MDLKFSPEHEALRADIRNFFATDYPQDILEKLRVTGNFTKEDHVRSQQAMQSRGWFGYFWPVEAGGTGWGPVERYIFEEELDRVGALSIVPMALYYAGPVIYTFGTDDQKERWLPGILNSRDFWCQGYSEPEAGSDLSALTFSAVRDGDDYVLNGTKIWTSYAQWANWMFLLARTSVEDKKHHGISFICAEMDDPGISISPIISIDGKRHVNIVTFRDVRVPVANRIGEEGAGWRQAMFLLQNERLSYAKISRKKSDMKRLRNLAETTPDGRTGFMIDNPLFMRRVAKCEMKINALEVFVLKLLMQGENAAPADVSALKVFVTESSQEITELYVELGGRNALANPPRTDLDWAQQAPGLEGFEPVGVGAYFYSRAETIYGGTTEIQKNTMWKAISRRND